MDNLSTAKKIVNILEKKGYKAFIVGGAVRDYLLRQKLVDIDITTSAKPTELMRMFTTKPTGLKYGTVTVLFDEQTFEVTTFRLDGPTNDFRHPDSVIYSESELDDVSRRDFTINGLLMDAKGKIYDHVNGLDDIKNKVIRAIGDPLVRFSEDALRILRAIYFQSRLGFTIDSDTLAAMSQKNHLLNEISNERILQELLKILRGKYVFEALKTMVNCDVALYLPGLEKGIKHCLTLDIMPFIDPFFVICFILNDGIVPNEWRFSNQQRLKYKMATTIAINHPVIDSKVLYQYGLENCLLANKANSFLGNSKYAEKKIIAIYEQLPVKSELDLAISANEMIDLLNKKAGSWISKARINMVNLVLDNKLVNQKEVLIEYLLKTEGQDAKSSR